MSSSISPNDWAKIRNNFKSSKLFDENLLFVPNARGIARKEQGTLLNTSGVIGNTPRVFKNTFGVIIQVGIVK